MSSDKSIGDMIEKVFGEFKKVTPALISVLVASGLILFLPEKVLSKMALSNLPESWKRIISFIFLVSISLIAAIGISEVVKKLENCRIRKKLRKQYIELSSDCKNILIGLLRSRSKKMKLDYTAGTTQYLISNGFIHQVQSYMFVGPGYIEPVDFVPQPWLVDLYNKEPDLFK
ncbi:super-infection exclusion protein B [Fournierella sp.]|uniref:super-infection exclusion protein B n=1 Tax=Allofournierella sp. TaxID=1940256 RepID=UPI0025B86031|nr:super-infection exclusion protein B [Fournierella sp.]